MGIVVKRTGSAPTQVWDRQAMARFANGVKGIVEVRTFQNGIGQSGEPLKPYSTTPIKVYYRSQRGDTSVRPARNTGIRLKPKGGLPFFWVRGPRRADGTYDRKYIGKEAGRFYPGGYGQYKRESRKGPRNAEVDLVLSGTMAREFGVKRVGETEALIGVSGASVTYAGFVDAARPFMGLGPADEELALGEFEAAIDGAVKRSTRNAR